MERHSLKLNEAREKTPAVDSAEALRRQLSMAVFNGVKESDVVAMVEKIKEQAMAGDHKAQKMFFDLIGATGKAAPPPPAQDSAGLKMMAEALTDLVDEIRISKAPGPKSRKQLANGVEDDE